MFTRSISRIASISSNSALRFRIAPTQQIRFYSTIKYTKSHEWIRVDGDIGTVGISDFAQRELGDIVFVEGVDTGKKIKAGEPVTVVESVKAASDIFSPVSGEIIGFNADLQDEPELINTNPMDDGYIYKIKLSNKSELNDLLDKDPVDE